MRRATAHTAVALAVSLAIGCGGGSSSHEMRPSSPLAITPDTVVFGFVPLNAKVILAYTAANTSGAPIEIRKITSSCPCLQTEPDDFVIPPMGRTTIRVLFDSKGFYPGMTLVKHATVFTDLPKPDTVHQAITIGYDGAPVVPDTGVLHLSRDPRTPGLFSASTALSNATQAPLMCRVETSAPELGALVEPPTIAADGGKARLRIVAAQEPPHDFYGSVTITTSAGTISIAVQYP